MKTLKQMFNESLHDEQANFFDKRTKLHIGLVKEYADKVIAYSPKFAALKEQVNHHDASKYKSPEYEPYLHITGFHKMKDEGKNIIIQIPLKIIWMRQHFTT